MRPSRQTRGHGCRCGRGAASSGSGGGRGQLLDEGFDSGAQAADRHLSTHHRRETVLQNQRRIEVLDLQKPLGSLLQRFLRNQSDNFAAIPG